MITFAILLVILLAMLAISAFCIVAGGAGIILVFGDLIIFGAIIWLLVRLFRRKK